MLADLARSGLDAGDAETMRLQPHSSVETRIITNGKTASPSYRIPYLDAEGKVVDFFRLRFLADVRKFGDKKPQRYWQPPASAPRVYLPNEKLAKVFGDPRVPVQLVEGEKKAALLNKVSGMPTLGLGGAWNFGSAKQGVDLIEELRALAEGGREIVVFLDGDRATNPHVARAGDILAQRLAATGARVWFVEVPPGAQVDDAVVLHGPEVLSKWPRRPLDPKRQVAVARTLPKLSARDRHDLVAGIVRADMGVRGAFHDARGEPLYFDRRECRLLTLADHRDPQLRAFANDTYGLNAAENEFLFVHHDLQAHALRHGARTDVHRFAHFDRGAGRMHLHVAAGLTYRVTASGCEKVPNGSDGVLFRETSADAVEPARSQGQTAFRYVARLPNFRGTPCLSASRQQLIYELWIWSLFFQRVGPILVVDAPKGAGKTTGARALGLSLLGPSFDVFVAERDRLDDFATVLTNSDLVVADNLDGRYPGFENLLCLAATGGQVPRRKLFTTNEQINYRISARVIATTREPVVFTRDDLRDRSIFLRLERRETFEPEQEITARVLDGRPRFWSHVLATLPKIVKALAAPPASTGHRLADFASFCLAAGPALGHARDEVVAALDGIEAERTAFAEDHCSILRALLAWVDGQRSFAAKAEGGSHAQLGCKDLPTGTLFEHVRGAWPHGRFPFANSQSFGLALKNEEPLLRQHFEIERRNRRAHQTLVTIRPREDER
jgi:hypothetical protein